MSKYVSCNHNSLFFLANSKGLKGDFAFTHPTGPVNGQQYNWKSLPSVRTAVSYREGKLACLACVCIPSNSPKRTIRSWFNTVIVVDASREPTNLYMSFAALNSSSLPHLTDWDFPGQGADALPLWSQIHVSVWDEGMDGSLAVGCRSWMANSHYGMAMLTASATTTTTIIMIIINVQHVECCHRYNLDLSRGKPASDIPSSNPRSIAPAPAPAPHPRPTPIRQSGVDL